MKIDLDFLHNSVNLKLRKLAVVHRRRNKKLDKLRPRTFTDDVPPMMTQTTMDFDVHPMHMALTSVDDLITSRLLNTRFNAGKDVHMERLYVMTSVRSFKNYYYAQRAKHDMQLYIFGEENGVIVFREDNYWEYSVESSTVRLKIVGDQNFVEQWVEQLHADFNIADSFIEWMYSADGSSAHVPITDSKKPMAEMYPFLSTNLFEYYDNFMKSSASVLVLIGAPGTGKTTFIRGLLQHSKTNALVSYDPAILEKDHIFVRFIEGTNNVMVLEDADSFLGNRTEGNTVMHKFLNVGDGLITTQGKKMIFSTNLPSIKDIDPALIRPGRCFDVIEFRSLKPSEHNILCDKLGLEHLEDKEKTLAEIFYTQVEVKKIKKKNMGFY